MQTEDLIQWRQRGEFILSDLFLLCDFPDNGLDRVGGEWADVFLGGCGGGIGRCVCEKSVGTYAGSLRWRQEDEWAMGAVSG